MPYILAEDRTRLDVHIEALAKEIIAIADEYKTKAEGAGRTADGSFAGLLNYACTRLALEVVPERRYWTIALVSGVFKNIGDEFYRRYGVPYEEEQIAKNGDVYDA